MKIRRTGNAGVLLQLDGVSILLDGVCREVFPYLVTPPTEREALLECPPDVMVITHDHADHFDPDYAAKFLQAGGVIFGSRDISGGISQNEITVENVKITAVTSRHIGTEFKDVPHQSYIIQGSRCIWFLGDAAPQQWHRRLDLPKPDVLIVPFAYLIGNGWKISQELGAEVVILVHMPDRSADPYDLWSAVAVDDKKTGKTSIMIPEIGKDIFI